MRSRHHLPGFGLRIEAFGFADRAFRPGDHHAVPIAAGEDHDAVVRHDHGIAVPARPAQRSGQSRGIAHVVAVDLDRIDTRGRHRQVAAGAAHGDIGGYTAGGQELGFVVAAVFVRAQREHGREGRTAHAGADRTFQRAGVDRRIGQLLDCGRGIADGRAHQIAKQAGDLFAVQIGRVEGAGQFLESDLIELERQPGIAQIGPLLGVRIVGGHDIPKCLIVGLAERIECLAAGVVIDLAVRQQVQAREQRQRALCGVAVLAPAPGIQVVGFGLRDVAPGVQRLFRIHRLEQLGDTAGHEHVTVGEGHEGGVPAPERHVAALRPRIALRVEDTRGLEPFEFDHAHRQAVHAGLGVVVGPAYRHHAAIGKEYHVRAEQGAVVLGGVVGGGQNAVGHTRQAARDGFAVVALRVGAAVDRGGFFPRRRVAFAQAEYPRLIVDGDLAELGHDRQLHVLGAFQGIEIDEAAVAEIGHRAGRRLAAQRAVLARQAAFVGFHRFTVDHEGGFGKGFAETTADLRRQVVRLGAAWRGGGSGRRRSVRGCRSRIGGVALCGRIRLTGIEQFAQYAVVEGSQRRAG